MGLSQIYMEDVLNHKKLWKNRAYKTATGFVCDQSPVYQFVIGAW